MSGMSKRLALIVVLAAALTPARAEVIEEIVAKVNDDVITKSDLDTEEAGSPAGALPAVLRPRARRAGEDGEGRPPTQSHRPQSLAQRAGRLFDMTKMQDYFLQSFKDQQNIKSDKDLEKMLAQEGTTLTAWKKKLVEYFAPQQVLRAEVADRIAISDAEMRTYYDTHITEFTVYGEATVREIVVKSDPRES
jgi:hypothetical protein